jgi:serine/threonine-protein kinase SRPK3
MDAFYLDIHLNNILIKLPSSFDNLSIEQLCQEYGDPETVPVTRCDGEPLPPNVPAKVVAPLFLGKYAENSSLLDAQLLLGDFGGAFSLASEISLGRDSHTPLAFRAPEAKFKPQAPLSYPFDIWRLATVIWEIIGMKAVFSTDFVCEDEMVAQHVDVLGSMPSEWWRCWEGRRLFFDEQGNPTESYQKNRWPSLADLFEMGIQKWGLKSGGAIDEDEKTAFLDLMR